MKIIQQTLIIPNLNVFKNIGHGQAISNNKKKQMYTEIIIEINYNIPFWWHR